MITRRPTSRVLPGNPKSTIRRRPNCCSSSMSTKIVSSTPISVFHPWIGNTPRIRRDGGTFRPAGTHRAATFLSLTATSNTGGGPDRKFSQNSASSSGRTAKSRTSKECSEASNPVHNNSPAGFKPEHDYYTSFISEPALLHLYFQYSADRIFSCRCYPPVPTLQSIRNLQPRATAPSTMFRPSP
jgi:hypothetical protein